MNRSEIMSRIRSKGTKPEIIFEAALKAKGLKFKKQYGIYKIDFAFPKEKIAVFIDGCFWHGCKKCYKKPKTNKKYWEWKKKYNAKRDKKQTLELKRSGWKVIRIWEHSVNNRSDFHADKILNLVMRR